MADAMAAVVGIGRADHARIVELLWKYIKANDLQNPSDKCEVRCDGKLKAVFKVDVVTSFGLTELIGAHILRDGDSEPPAKRAKN